MTREEAIKLLTQYIDYDAETPDYYEMEKACKVAIKALEHPERNVVAIVPCGDAIDRKLVYAFLSGLISDETERKKALEYINELPPVNPIEPCSDAIDRAKAIIVASGYCHPSNVAKELAKLPSVNPQPICEEREKGECPYYAG